MWQEELSPISLTAIKKEKEEEKEKEKEEEKEGEVTCFYLQNKDGLILILEYSANQNKFTGCQSYRIGMVGFTKLPIYCYYYEKEGTEEIRRQIEKNFLTVSTDSGIEKR